MRGGGASGWGGGGGGDTVSHNLRLLHAALADPIDTRAAFTVLVRMMQQRIEELASQRSAGAERDELVRLDDAFGAYDERLKYIKQQVLVEQVLP